MVMRKVRLPVMIGLALVILYGSTHSLSWCDDSVESKSVAEVHAESALKFQSRLESKRGMLKDSAYHAQSYITEVGYSGSAKKQFLASYTPTAPDPLDSRLLYQVILSSDKRQAQKALMMLVGLSEQRSSFELNNPLVMAEVSRVIEEFLDSENQEVRIAASTLLARIGIISDKGLKQIVSQLEEDYRFVGILQRLGRRAIAHISSHLEDASERYVHFALDVIVEERRKTIDLEVTLREIALKGGFNGDRAIEALEGAVLPETQSLLRRIAVDPGQSRKTRLLAAHAIRGSNQLHSVMYASTLNQFLPELIAEIENSPVYWGGPLWLLKKLGADARGALPELARLYLSDDTPLTRKLVYGELMQVICFKHEQQSGNFRQSEPGCDSSLLDEGSS